MEISLIDDAIGWRTALAKIGKHESYHTWDFHRIDTHGNGDFFAIEVTAANSALFFPVVARKIPQSDFYDLTSVYGYPGPIHVGAPEEFPVMLEAAFTQLREMGYVSVFSRCSVFAMRAEAALPECYSKSGKVVTIDLRIPLDAQWRLYRDNLRREINRAIADGLECQQAHADEASSFIDLYHRTMNRVVANSHYYFDQDYVLKMMSSADFDCRLYVCRYDRKIISAALFVFCNDVVQYHLSGSDEAYSKLGASKMLIDYVRRIAVQEGYAVMNLGGGLGGMADHLYSFKRGFSRNEKDFFVIKKVLNPDTYQTLLSCPDQQMAGSSDFFPAYRQRAPSLDDGNVSVCESAKGHPR